MSQGLGVVISQGLGVAEPLFSRALFSKGSGFRPFPCCCLSFFRWLAVDFPSYRLGEGAVCKILPLLSHRGILSKVITRFETKLCPGRPVLRRVTLRSQYRFSPSRGKQVRGESQAATASCLGWFYGFGIPYFRIHRSALVPFLNWIAWSGQSKEPFCVNIAS